MHNDLPSRTAWRAALARARHQVLDGGRVLSDPLAVRIVGPQALDDAATPREGRVGRAMRLPIAARSRIAEDTLARAVAAQQVRQYVLLGAGLDTFAYRNPWMDLGVRVFEVDHPATQRWKHERLAAAGIAVPDGVRYVALDFARDDIVARLLDAGYEPERPAVFAWLGVVIYLTRAQFTATLCALRRLAAPGSRVVFDFVRRPSGFDLAQRLMLRLLGRRYARLGEPWRGPLSAQDIGAAAAEAGFAAVELVDPRRIVDTMAGGAPALTTTQRMLGRGFGGVAVLGL